MGLGGRGLNGGPWAEGLQAELHLPFRGQLPLPPPFSLPVFLHGGGGTSVPFLSQHYCCAWANYSLWKGQECPK